MKNRTSSRYHIIGIEYNSLLHEGTISDYTYYVDPARSPNALSDNFVNCNVMAKAKFVNGDRAIITKKRYFVNRRVA